MIATLADIQRGWSHSFEDVLGLIFVLGVVGAYSLLFAFTRRPRLGWIITAAIAFAAITILIVITPHENTAAGHDPSAHAGAARTEIGSASCRGRVCHY